MHRSLTYRLPVLAAIAATAGVLAAGLLAVGPAAAETKVRGVTDTEIVIGTHTDLSGVTATWGLNNSNAIRMKFDEVNAAGGINGRKIRYIVEDSQYQVPRAVQAANKLLNRDNVFMMIAAGGTPMNNAVLPEQLAKNVPNMFPLTSARAMAFPFHKLKFMLNATYYDQIRAGMKYFVEKRGKKTPCVAYQDTDFGRDIYNGVVDEAKALNVKIAAETAHRPTDTDFSAAIAKLRDAKCDMVLLGTITRDTNQIVAAARKVGWDVDMVGQIAIYDVVVAEAPGGVNEGVYAMTAIEVVYPDDPRPPVQKFMKDYKEKYGREPNFAAQIGYSDAELVIEGLKAAGKDLTVDGFIAAMEKIKNYQDIFGSPPVSFGPEKHQGSNVSVLTQVKDRRWVRVDGPLSY